MALRRLVFLDVETTGFDPVKQEIIELGAIVAEPQGSYADLKIIHEIEIKVQPQRIEDADPGALRINGYEPEQWMFAHSLEEAMQELSQKAKDASVVAHNVAFDWAFIGRAYDVTGVENTLHYHKFDTLSMAFALIRKDPDLKNLSLNGLCEYFGIVNERAHTALADTRATMKVFQELMKLT